MSSTKKNDVREPLIHLSKRTDVNQVRAWAVRVSRRERHLHSAV